MMKANFALFVLLSLFSQLIAAKPKPMTPVDLINLPSVSNLVLSPNGDEAVYLKKHSNWQKNKQITDIWSVDLNSGTHQQLTFDASTEKALTWSINGNWLMFLDKQKEDKKVSLYKMNWQTKVVEKELSFDSSIKKFIWAKHSEDIYFLSSSPLMDEADNKSDIKHVLTAFESPNKFTHVWRYNLKTKVINQVTQGDFHVLDFDLAQTERFIVFKKSWLNTIDAENGADVWQLDLSSARQTRLTNNDYAEKAIQLSPDGNSLLFISDVNEQGDYYYDANLFVLDIATNKLVMLDQDFIYEVEDARWAKDSKHVYLRANMGVRSEIWQVKVAANKFSQLTDGKHTVKNWHYDSNTDHHSFNLYEPKDPGELWLMKGQSKKLRQITHLFDDIEQQYQLPDQQLIKWQSADGVTLEGLLTLPLNYNKDQRYPLIVHSHGGPKSSDQYGQFKWRTYIPIASAQGYAYFSINYRGGRGYGDEFMRDMVGGYFNNAHLDILSGVDHLIELGIADPKQLAKAGWSAGGHMTNKIITMTDRFKAASSGAGAIDWISMYGETDTRYDRTSWFGGKPWQQDAPIATYIKHSPLKDTWKVSTPTIIFVGGNDVRVPPTQSKILYRALRDNGVDSKLYIAPGEPHGYQKLTHRLFKINAELAWFDKYLRNKDYVWQSLPKAALTKSSNSTK